MKRILLLWSCMFIFLYTTAQVCTFEFTTAPYIPVTTNNGNVTVSDMTISAGSILTNQTAGTYFPNEPYIGATSGWAQTTQAAAKKFCFNIVVASGCTMDITSVSYNAYATSAGPAMAGFSVGSTNYAATTMPLGGAAVTPISATTPTQTNLTGTVQVCLQGWGAVAGGGDFRIDDVVVAGTLNCGIPCSITAAGITTACSDNGTPNDPSDDTYTFTLNPTHTGAGTQYNITGDVTGGPINYGTPSGTFGPFAISAGNKSVTITDNVDMACTISATVTAPAPCSVPVCTLTCSGYTTVCASNTSGTDTYTAIIPFRNGTTLGGYTVTTTAGTLDMSTYGQNPGSSLSGAILLSGLTEGSGATVTIVGNNCNITINITSPACDAPTSTDPQLTILSQAINPCGNDGVNEFIIGEVTGGDLNMADMAFGSAMIGSGGAMDNFNYWWAGTNVPSNPYNITGLSTNSPETCGSSGVLECYGFLYPSIPADAAIIDARILELNTVAGCAVFKAVPATNIIPAGAKIFVLLGAALCPLDNPTVNLNFSNHCPGPIQEYYLIVGTGTGANPPACTGTSGYFKNRETATPPGTGVNDERNSFSMVLNASPNTAVASYDVSSAYYNPGTVSGGVAGVGTPSEIAGVSTWTNDACIPTPTELAVPVELKDFRATAQNRATLLIWVTASETNNSHFEVEHSTDGKRFTNIGKVLGKGNSSSISSYNFTHSNPALGLNYYRLKQVDFDGKYEYSAIRAVNFRKAASIKIVPSFAKDQIKVQLGESLNKATTLEVFDLLGKLVLTHTVAAQQTEATLNVTHLANGQYLVRLNHDTWSATERFIKLD